MNDFSVKIFRYNDGGFELISKPSLEDFNRHSYVKYNIYCNSMYLFTIHVLFDLIQYTVKYSCEDPENNEESNISSIIEDFSRLSLSNSEEIDYQKLSAFTSELLNEYFSIALKSKLRNNSKFLKVNSELLNSETGKYLV